MLCAANFEAVEPANGEFFRAFDWKEFPAAAWNTRDESWNQNNRLKDAKRAAELCHESLWDLAAGR